MNNAGLYRAAGIGAAMLLVISLASFSPADEKPPAAAAPATAKDFSGKYLADGIGNGGRPYRAMVEIRKHGDMYDVLWVLGPREAYAGVGLVEGDSLCVGWASNQVPGVIVYASQKGKLVGRWTAPGSEGKTFKETLTPVK